MQTCGSCFGTGKVQCFSCGGRGRKSRLTVRGDLEINSCLVCNGSGRTRCNFCGGRGKIGDISGYVSTHTPTASSKQSIAEEMYHKGVSLWGNDGYTDPDLAINYFTQAISIDRDNANTYHARGLAYHQVGKFIPAIKDFGRAIKLYPDESEYYNARGNTYYALNKVKQAKQDWEKASNMGNKYALGNLIKYQLL